MKIKVIDFFCGSGGTSSGLKQAGMDIIAGIDIDDIALKTFEKNFPEACIINQDIRTIPPSKIKGLTKKYKNHVLFSACAPCQPFSKQNRQKSSTDKRKSLLDYFHPFITKCSPALA